MGDRELEEIDPIYYDTTYCMLPTEEGEKPYRLLLQAMADSKGRPR